MIICIAFGLIGSLLTLFGFLVWKFKIASVIAGYDEKSVKDPDNLARWVGKCLMLLGLSASGLGLISYFFPSKNTDTVILLAFLFLSMIGSAITLAGVQRFYK